MPSSLDIKNVVRERYSHAAQTRVEALCCPVEYERRYLKVIPAEVLEHDYGCGDPSKYVQPGETVLDLGSGSGKICFIASQVVGQAGRVIGVDMNDDMLALARKHQRAVGDALGYHNIEFRKGRIQDLALDLERLDAELAARPIDRADASLAAETFATDLRARHPLVADNSMDVVVSNCVLNLVDSREKARLFREIFRVLKNGGRAVISDIVSDQEIPEAMQNDPELWSGCIAGALTEEGFLGGFAETGFYGIRLVKWNAAPWRTLQGIEFRAVTVEAFKGRQGECSDRNQTVIYKGPFKEVLDDDGHRMERGRRQAVSDRTFALLQKAPYRESFEFVEPRTAVSAKDARPIDSEGARQRHLTETKAEHYNATSQCCEGGNCC